MTETQTYYVYVSQCLTAWHGFPLHNKKSLAIPTLQREDYKTGRNILLYIKKNSINVIIRVFTDNVTYLNEILEGN